MTSAEIASPAPRVSWTSRQKEVLDLLACGYTNAEIAERLDISLRGAKWHVSEVISILGVTSRDEAADYWRKERSLHRRLARALGLLAIPAKALAIGAGVLVAGIAAVLVAIAVVALWGDDVSSIPATDPTPTPPTSTLAVYTRSIGIESASGRDWDLREVVVHNLADGAEAAWQYSDVGAYPVAASLAGNYVFTSTEQEIVRWHLDGSTRHSIVSFADEGLAVSNISASPDGTVLAATLDCVGCDSDAGEGQVLLFDVTSGEEMARLRKASDFPDFVGSPSGLHWRDDGSGVLVTGATEIEDVGGLMTVWSDRTVEVYDIVGGMPSPDGRKVVSPKGGDFCGEGFMVHNLDSGLVERSVNLTPGWLEIPLLWHPESTMIIWLETLPRWVETTPCPPRGVADTTPPLGDLFGWNLDTGPFDPGFGLDAWRDLLGDWYGPSRLEAQCGPGPTQVGSLEEHQRFPCSDSRVIAELVLAGTTFGSGYDLEYLGLAGPPLVPAN